MSKQIKIPLVKGALAGYHTNSKAEDRRNILKYYIKKDGWHTVFNRINALSIINKNRPRIHNKLELDINWLHKIHK